MTWLVIRAGAGPHLFNLGELRDDDLQGRIAAAKVLLGFPPGHDWVGAEFIPNQLPDAPPGRDLVPAYDVSVQGDPLHPDLLKVGTVHELAELEQVDPTALAEFNAAHDDAVRAARREALLAELARLDPDEVDALMTAHRDRTP